MSYPANGDVSAVLRPSAEHERLFNGAVVVDGRTTAGRYSAYRLVVQPDGGGATPHFHRTFSESFHVLVGPVQLYDGRAWVDADVGDHLFIPEGGIHGFRNVGDEPASLLMLTMPAALREAYFRELGEVVRGERQLAPEEWPAFLARHDQYAV